MQTHLTVQWADGSYDFRLTWPACAEIERKSDAGIQVIYERVMTGRAYSSDVSEIIRQGLIGGKAGIVDGEAIEVKPVTANALIDRYVIGVDAQPFNDSWMLAQTIIAAFMVGYEDKKKEDSAAADGGEALTE